MVKRYIPQIICGPSLDDGISSVLAMEAFDEHGSPAQSIDWCGHSTTAAVGVRIMHINRCVIRSLLRNFLERRHVRCGG